MLDGKSILITGAASGIGRASARLFADYGARLTLVDFAADGLAETAEGLADCQTVLADVRDTAACQNAVNAAIERFGGLDGAFNNAGTEGTNGRMIPTAAYPEDEFDRVIAVNLRGVWNCLRAELPVMLAARKGAIVNTASIFGWLGCSGMPAYVASKHGVIGLTRTAALDYAAKGIRVNALLPGAIDTPMLTGRSFDSNPGFGDVVVGLQPMKRLGQPSEMAEAAAWLLSDKASYVTGHTLAADGGFSIR